MSGAVSPDGTLMAVRVLLNTVVETPGAPIVVVLNWRDKFVTR